VLAAAALAAALIVLIDRDLSLSLGAVVAALAAVAATRIAFTSHAELPVAKPPSKPVLFFNPKSGGGKAERFHIADEARKRGIEPIELTFEEPLETLVERALAGGADGLAAGGGDGTQAIVAAAAARQGVPFACIPVGTRNHLALDLGVDRDDPVGALDAFVNGVERVVDLGEVNGRVFVNNVSLGLYAQAVQTSGYREAKLRTLLDTVPEFAGPSESATPIRWSGGDGVTHEGGMAVLISNNPYRLGAGIGSGTRPRLDSGELGVAVIGPHGEPGKRLMQVSSERSIEVDSDASVPAGIDGESAMLDAPVKFTIRPRALRVRLAPQHPGMSPSALVPEHGWQVPGEFMRTAFARGE
jgi:diacylglycerol kinase family enzyme